MAPSLHRDVRGMAVRVCAGNPCHGRWGCSFCLAGRIVAVAIQRSTGFRDQLWTALLNEIAGLVNYAFEDFDEFAYAGFSID